MAYEDGVFATFYDDALPNPTKTKKEGFAVFDEVPMIRIQVPNQLDCVPRPIQDADKERFPKSWEAYKTGREPAETGFPLEQWPQLTAGELKVCQANQIKTVEQLAEVADNNLHRLGQGGVGLKTRAVKFIQSLGETDHLRQENLRLTKENADIMKRLDKLESAKGAPRKRLKVAK